MPSSLSTQTKYVRAVINFPFSNDDETILENLTRHGWTWAMITHDQDTDGSGSPKTPHVHIIIIGHKRARLSTFLVRLADVFGVKETQVSVQGFEEWSREVQYLIHANNPEKHQYLASSIISSLSPADIELALLEETQATLDIGRLLDVVSRSTSVTEVMITIGLHNYAVYRNVVGDLIRDGYLGANLPNEALRKAARDRYRTK